MSNLSPSLSENDLLEMFAAFRPSIARIDREKCSAVLELEGDVMEDVVQRLHGLTVDGQEIQVQLSVLIEPRALRGTPEDDLRPMIVRPEKPPRSSPA